MTEDSRDGITPTRPTLHAGGVELQLHANRQVTLLALL